MEETGKCVCVAEIYSFHCNRAVGISFLCSHRSYSLYQRHFIFSLIRIIYGHVGIAYFVATEVHGLQWRQQHFRNENVHSKEINSAVMTDDGAIAAIVIVFNSSVRIDKV